MQTIKTNLSMWKIIFYNTISPKCNQFRILTICSCSQHEGQKFRVAYS